MLRRYLGRYGTLQQHGGTLKARPLSQNQTVYSRPCQPQMNIEFDLGLDRKSKTIYASKPARTAKSCFDELACRRSKIVLLPSPSVVCAQSQIDPFKSSRGLRSTFVKLTIMCTYFPSRQPPSQRSVAMKPHHHAAVWFVCNMVVLPLMHFLLLVSLIEN